MSRQYILGKVPSEGVISEAEKGLAFRSAAPTHSVIMEQCFLNQRRRMATTILAISAIALIVGLVLGLKGNDTNPSGSRGVPGNVPTTSVFKLDEFGIESLTPYPGCEDLRTHLAIAAAYLANFTINDNIQWFYHSDYPSDCFGCNYKEPEVSEAAQDSASLSDSSGGNEGEDSYLTNNQVEGVDEADVVKSDGIYVYAAYGNEIVVWDAANVTIHSRTTVSQMSDEVGTTVSTTRGTNGSQSEVGSECNTYVQSLLLYENRLVVIASKSCYLMWQDQMNVPALSDTDTTTVYVYDTSSVPDDGTPLTLLSVTSLLGYYVSARSIESNVHVVTSSYVDSYSSFLRYLDRFNSELYPQNLTEAEYRIAAQAEAERVIPTFVDALLEQLKEATNDDTCSHIVRLSLFQSSSDGTTTEPIDLAINALLSSLTLVTSFDVSGNLAASLATTASSIFLPTSYSNVYASQDYIVLGGQGWNQGTDGEWREETFLVGYRLNGATSSAASIGRVSGYLLNQFAMDHTESGDVNYLRVATTNSALWGPSANDTQVWEPKTDSSNQITVFAFPADDATDRTMTVVGQLTDLGVTEQIYAVRFLGDLGYVVTFRQTDPFYTIDLSDPTNPIKVGELKIPGYSNYLHPVSEGRILAVGQSVDEETGQARGLQITLFDVTDPANTVVVQQYIESGYSSSGAQYDHRAFRYLSETKVLILPLEIYGYNVSDYFDGFVVYDIDAESGISPRFNISHADDNAIRYGCWGGSFLQARSLVFSGNLMTLKAHTVLSTDLETGVLETDPLNLDSNQPEAECVVYFIK